MPVRLTRPVQLLVWQQWVVRTVPDATFHDHRAVFTGPATCSIADRLKEILDGFGTQGVTAVFAIQGNDVFGFWIDAHHNYFRIVFAKAAGDEFDGVSVMSMGDCG